MEDKQMTRERMIYLHQRYLAKTLTAQEHLELDGILRDLNSSWLMEDFTELKWNETDLDIPALETARSSEIFEYIIEQPQNKILVKLWPGIATIAAALALMILGVYFFVYKNQPIKDHPNLVVHDIAPGKQGATLTLANGRKINLSDMANGELAKQAGVIISKTAEGQIVYELKKGGYEGDKINTLTTAKGETYVLTLPDKSVVWLNAASSITYSANLNEGGIRKVKLEGEGYFEVTKDKAHPFVVESKGQQVEVLGTHFNINSYADEPSVKTTLLEGSVKVLLPKNGFSEVLSPGFQAIKTTNGLQVKKVNTDLIVAWKNNNFTFDLLQIQEIMPMIARWYNVEIVYVGVMPKERFWGSVSRFENISKVLEALAATENVHFKLEGKQVYVSKP